MAKRTFCSLIEIIHGYEVFVRTKLNEAKQQQKKRTCVCVCVAHTTPEIMQYNIVCPLERARERDVHVHFISNISSKL